MRTFLLAVLKVLIALVIFLFLLDGLFTYVYHHGAPRDNVRWIRSMQDTTTLDYVLLGSSRTIYSIDPNIIDKETGLNGLNVGYPSSGPVEIKLMLGEVLRKRKVRTVFIQADYYWNMYTPDSSALISWMPYIRDKEIYDEYIKYDDRFRLYKFFPFYRYIKYEGVIGVRNVFQSVAGRPVLQTLNKGYFAVDGVLTDTTALYYELNSRFNPLYKDMIEMCRLHGAKPVFFTSPLYHFTGNHDLFKKVLPDYTDFSNVIEDPEMFKDKKHINQEGAKIFTRIFTRHYFGDREINPEPVN